MLEDDKNICFLEVFQNKVICKDGFPKADERRGAIDFLWVFSFLLVQLIAASFVPVHLLFIKLID